jgi:hypothetical protein
MISPDIGAAASGSMDLTSILGSVGGGVAGEIIDLIVKVQFRNHSPTGANLISNPSIESETLI